MIASKARCGPIPLRWAYGALRGNGPALAEEALGRIGLSRCAREGLWWGCLEMTEAELSNLMQHDPIERPRSKTTSSV